jgi:hypothetical protein
MMKFDEGDVVKHISAPDTVGLVIEAMPAYPSEDAVIRDISGNNYQVYWSIAPPGDTDLDENWYPEEHLAIIKEQR